jgi:hypothetical protein
MKTISPIVFLLTSQRSVLRHKYVKTEVHLQELLPAIEYSLTNSVVLNQTYKCSKNTAENITFHAMQKFSLRKSNRFLQLILTGIPQPY